MFRVSPYALAAAICLTAVFAETKDMQELGLLAAYRAAVTENALGQAAVAANSKCSASSNKWI